MYLKEVVIDASPLIALFKSQQADLLNQLFSQVLVPEAVWNEVIENKYDDLASQDFRNIYIRYWRNVNFSKTTWYLIVGSRSS